MEFFLTHTPNSNYSRDTLPALMEMGKTVTTTPEKYAPGAKLLFTYAGRVKMAMYCLWDAPSAEVLMPALEQMSMLGYDTEIIPVEKMTVKLDKIAKAMAAMK